MIEVRGLTKRFGATTAVDELTFSVRPGTVTGFLGPNGAGKSTTMRVLLGLDRPTSGEALIDGRRYADAAVPLREVGALLDARDVHGGRTARKHLLALAQSNGLPARRVEEVLEVVGLAQVADRRVKGFSLGMSQRLGIAATLLGDPPVLLYDEPVNGLDPEGILWIRTFMKALAAEGRTVLVSSHLMSEMSLTADHLVVIGRGRLLADVSVPVQQHAVLDGPGAARTGWRAAFRAPYAGGTFAVLARAVDATGGQDPEPALTTFSVAALGHPPETVLTAPSDGQALFFPSSGRTSVPVTVRGTASDPEGVHPGVASVRVLVENLDHEEYWCGPAGCAGAGADGRFSPQEHWVRAVLDRPGATSTGWSLTFPSYDHPHRYHVEAYAVDADGHRDSSPAQVEHFCVNDPSVRSCY